MPTAALTLKPFFMIAREVIAAAEKVCAVEERRTGSCKPLESSPPPLLYSNDDRGDSEQADERRKLGDE